MANKLPPPLIAGTLPAFYDNKLIVPFQMNRAVSKNEFIDFSVKIKTVQNSRLIATSSTSDSIDFNNNTITFIFDGNKFRVGQFYKIQIAYATQSGEIGFYSTVGVAKYTTRPDVYIEGLQLDKNNFHQYSYTGVYSQKTTDAINIKDATEKLYSYQFNLYDNNYNLVLTSGELIHNSIEDDEPNQSINTFVINKDLARDQKYYLTYNVTTINGLQISSDYYPIVQKNSITPTFNFTLSADASDRENGIIKISLHGKKQNESDEKSLEIPVTGAFKLLRAGSDTNFTEWNEILDFSLYKQEPSRLLYVDYTAEHGIVYKYAVVQCSKYQLWSNKVESELVSCDFEHAYLYDGTRQLKIKFDPKVSSFKNTILESKMDTIGSKHPFIFRNGNVSYKEFPISGLISFQMDEDNLFYEKSFDFDQQRTFDYTYTLANISNEPFALYENIWNELFYLKNGELVAADRNFDPSAFYCYYNSDKNEYVPYPKKIFNVLTYSFDEYFNRLYVFRSGEYISIASQDNLHTFNKDEKYYLQSLKQNNIFPEKTYHTYSEENIQLERVFKLEVLEWLNNGQPKLFRSPTEGNYIVRLMNNSLSPNDTLGRLLHSFSSTAYEVADNTFNNIKNYGLLNINDPSENIISWESVDIHDALYGEDSKRKNNLLKYKAVAVRFEGMLPGDRVFINDGIMRVSGTDEQGEKIYAPGQWIVIGATGSYNIDLSANVEITAIQLADTNNLGRTIRHQGTLTYAYYRSSFNTFDTIQDIDIYDVPLKQIWGPCAKGDFLSYFKDIKHDLQKIHFLHAKYIDQVEAEYVRPPLMSKEEEPKDAAGCIFINGQEVYLKDTKDLFIKNLDTFDIYFGSNVLVEVCYQMSEVIYDIENNPLSETYTAKNNYNNALTKLENSLFNTPSSEYIIAQNRKAMNDAYATFIETLARELNEQEGTEGETI